MKKYLKRKLQDEIQDMQDVEVNMKDYLDIMSDVKEVDAKRQRMSDSDVELDEESYLGIMSEDIDISKDGNSNIEDKVNDRFDCKKWGGWSCDYEPEWKCTNCKH